LNLFQQLQIKLKQATKPQKKNQQTTETRNS